MKIVIGVQDENDLVDRVVWDNVTLEVENVGNPATLIILE